MKRSPLRRMSEKKLAGLKTRPWSTISKRSESPRKSKDTDKGWTKKALPSVANQQQEPRTRGRPTNPARKAREFKRAYHSKERVLFVKLLPCVVCGHSPSENAHIETGGGSRKADYDKIVPLCGDRFISFFGTPPNILRGCHGELHDQGRLTFETLWHIDLQECAEQTEKFWQSRIPEREE